MKIISWNIAHRPRYWGAVAGLDADVALLQEACAPPSALRPRFNLDEEPWETGGLSRRRWRTAVVGLSPDVELNRMSTRSLTDAGTGDLVVSRVGTVSVAHVEHPSLSEGVMLVSMYASWETLHPHAGGNLDFADAAAHRLISDLSALVGRKRGHRIIAAGDLNCLYGHGEHGSAYWARRYQTVFDRFEAIGLAFVGPQAPSGGRQASPWPSELPATSRNVPTYYTAQQQPANATRQLDFVFASHDLVSRVHVRALNEVDAWGPSDHCQLEIVLSNA